MKYPSRVDYPFIECQLGNQTFLANDAEHMMNLRISRTVESVSESVNLSIYDRTGYFIERSLRSESENPTINIRYGWSEGESSPVYTGRVQSYTVSFVSPTGDTIIDLESVADGVTEMLQGHIEDYGDMRIDEIVRKIAKRNGWAIGNIEPCIEVYDDTPEKNKKKFIQDNRTDEEFINKYLLDQATSARTGKSDFVFRLSTDTGTPTVWFEPRTSSSNVTVDSTVQTTDSDGKTVSKSESSNDSIITTNTPDSQTIGGDINISEPPLEYTYVLGSSNSEGIISISMTYDGPLSSVASSDELTTQYMDSQTNELRETTIKKNSTYEDAISTLFPRSNTGNKLLDSMIDNSNPMIKPQNLLDNLESRRTYLSGGDRAERLSRKDIFIQSIVDQNGKSYVYGSAGPNSFDCSGLISYGLNKAGYLSGGRVTTGSIKNYKGKVFKEVSRNDLQPGDIMVVHNNSRQHVELYLGDKTFGAHSPSSGIGFRDAKGHMNAMKYTNFYRLIDQDNTPLANSTISKAKITTNGSRYKSKGKSIARTSGSVSEVENQSQAQMDKLDNIGWSGELTIIGDPTIKPMSIVNLQIYTAVGSSGAAELHEASGSYMIQEVVDYISNGEYTTTLKLGVNGYDSSTASYDENGNLTSASGLPSVNGSTNISTSKDQFSQAAKSRGHKNTIYYNQGDDAWGGNSGYNVKGNGCGPTSLAMILTSLTGKNITPSQIVKYASNKGYYSSNDGTLNRSYFTELGNQYGFDVVSVTSKAKHKEMLSKGYIGINHHTKGYWTNGGHFTVAAGIDSSGRLLVNDPGSRGKSKKAHGDDTAYSGWDVTYFFVPKKKP